MPWKRLLAPAIAALCCAISAPAAPAGTLTVYSCTTPTGTWTGMTGWTSSASAVVQGQDPGIATTCTAAKQQFTLEYGATQLPVGPGNWLSWSFAAPAGTSIHSISVPRSVDLGWPIVNDIDGRPYVYDAWHDNDVSANQLEFLFPARNGDMSGVNYAPVLSRENISWSSISLRLRCWESMGSGNCQPYRAKVLIPRATIGLTDNSGPNGTVSAGTLSGASPVRGVGDLAFHATDVGTGVYRSILGVDGQEVDRRVVDDAGGTCADVEPGNGDAYEFGSPQPCPTDVSGTVDFDTSSLLDGGHTVRLSLEDAAGNASIVYDGSFTTHNAPVNVTSPAVSGTLLAGSVLTTDDGEWDGAPTAVGYRWLRCDGNGANCAGIAGAASASYQLTSADVSHRLVAEVTAQNGSGSAVARSGPTALVQAPASPPPPTGSGGTGAGGTDAGGTSTSGGTTGTGNTGTSSTTSGSAPATTTTLIAPPSLMAAPDPPHATRIELAFQLASGRTAQRVRSSRNRRWLLAGRLLDQHEAGIPGATLDVAAKIAGRGWRGLAQVHADASGRFTYRLPAGPSRAVKVSLAPAGIDSNVVAENVLAPMAIAADHRHVTGKRVVRLRGRVGGGMIPRGGLLVTLQGWQRGWGWRTFRAVRTDRAGRWSTRYRFRLTHGRFAFRAILLRQGTYPYLTSRSKAVAVTVS
jgi:hypothetical protein